MASPRVLFVMIPLAVIGCAPTDTPASSSTGDADPAPSSSSGSGATATPTPTDHAPDPQSDPPGTATTDPFVDGFVAAHNQIRARVSPAANPALPAVRWSPELAGHAQRWADRCKFEHSDTEAGENLSARSDLAEPAIIVDAWAVEGESFDHARNRCASGQVCGHYTQVVWRGTTQIGCAVAQCTDNSPLGASPWFMWVCQYDPPGNWKGERPY